MRYNKKDMTNEEKTAMSMFRHMVGRLSKHDIVTKIVQLVGMSANKARQLVFGKRNR